MNCGIILFTAAKAQRPNAIVKINALNNIIFFIWSPLINIIISKEKSMSSLFYRLFDSITSVVSSFSIISSTSLFSITRGGTNLSTLLPAVMTIRP